MRDGHFPAKHDTYWNNRRYFVRTLCQCGKAFVCHDNGNYYDLAMNGKVWDAFHAHYHRRFDNSEPEMPWNGDWEGSEYVIRFF